MLAAIQILSFKIYSLTIDMYIVRLLEITETNKAAAELTQITEQQTSISGRQFHPLFLLNL